MPSSLEIRAWALAHREHPSTVALGIRSRRAGTLMADLHPMLGERYEGDADAALAGFRGPMTVDGGAPVRFGAPDADLATRATARFIDVSYWLRPLDEIAGGDRLCAEASDVRAPALAELADIRASRMLAGFRESMAMVCGEAGIPWAEIARRLARGAGLLDDWWRATRRSAHARDPRWRRDARAAADTVDALQPQIAASPALDDLALAGVGGYRTLSDAADWVAQVLRPQGRTTAVAESLLLDVRRYPNPQRRPDQRMGDAVPFSVLDVGDVLQVLARTTTHTGLSVMLQASVDVLGTAVRDPALLYWLLSQLPPTDALYRQGAVIALGALGSAASRDDLAHWRDDEDSVNAYFLALALSPLKPAVRAAEAEQILRGVAAPLRPWVEEVIQRFREGDTVAAVM
jgi:transposase-like protein